MNKTYFPTKLVKVGQKFREKSYKGFGAVLGKKNTVKTRKHIT